MRVCLMIEGQEGVTWEQWRALAAVAEETGFEALFRSDHYMALDGTPRRGGLDAWATLSALAATTSTLRLGTLVSPATFRHPSTLAREVVTAEHVAPGRIELGLGAGWHEREHAAHGFPYPDTKQRFDLLEEQLEIVRRSWAPEPFDFRGSHYTLERADPHPKPTSRPPLVMGGNAGPRAARLAARWADEYNTVSATPQECRTRREAIAAACERAGRAPIPFSLMTAFALDGPHADRLRAAAGPAPAAWLTGSASRIVERLRELEAAGVERVMLQHLLHDDLDTVRQLAAEVLPHVR